MRNLPSGYQGTTVLPKVTVTKFVSGVPMHFKVIAIHLDSNENVSGQPLHEVHGENIFGEFKFWFETTDSLKRLLNACFE